MPKPRPLIDPNQWSKDGTIALWLSASPSDDAKLPGVHRQRSRFRLENTSRIARRRDADQLLEDHG